MVHIAAECWPFARTGGLGEVVAALADRQRSAGRGALVCVPFYRQILEMPLPLVDPPGTPARLSVRVGDRDETVTLRCLVGSDGTPRVLFIDHPAFRDRAGLYGEAGADYADNPRRFAILCMAVLTALPTIAPDARIIHAHDWHAALAPAYLRTVFASSPYHQGLATVLSVHNAAFHGTSPLATISDVGLPSALMDWRSFEWYGQVNLLKGGIAFADMVTTVSRTHERELRSEPGGFGLHGAFAALGDRFVGIRNGIDDERWDPAIDRVIAARFSAEDLSGKARCKTAALEEFGLPVAPDVPLLALCARLTSQKGIDLLLASDLLASGISRLIVLGDGEERYRRSLTDLAARAPDRIAVRLGFRDDLEHILTAGADITLVPSAYEPCGLTPLRSQRYGTVPVAHRVGGLADSITDGETGFHFETFTPSAFDQALGRAFDRYADRAAWRKTMRAAMAREVGWREPVTELEMVYRRAMGRRAHRP